MIYTVGQALGSDLYTKATFSQFVAWEQQQEEYELDVETTVSRWWCERKLITVQFGSTDGSTQWVIRWLSLNDLGKAELKRILENKTKTKLIHNGLFEYVILRFHGITIENIFDTMLAEQILNGGITAKNGESLYGLSTVALNYLNVTLDKTLQKSFDETPLTPEQILYAADDVSHLAKIRAIQAPRLKAEKLENVANLEFEALCGYGDMMFNGIPLNARDWLKNLELVEPLIEESLKKLEAAVMEDPRLYQRAILLEHLSEEDRLLLNWNSSAQKQQVMKWMAPELELVTKAYVQKFLKKNSISEEIDLILTDMCMKDYTKANCYITKNYREDLIHHEFLIPAGKLVINWNSPVVLQLLQAVEPKLKGLDKEEMAKTTHPIIRLVQDYKDTLKLKTTYGEKFIEENLEPDGKIRTSFNQVVSTGRVSSSKPNMQNIPAKETVGNRYRNAFDCPTGWKYVDSDYAGQELVIIAYLSRDPVWTEALQKGQDLHSVCSELVFKNKWRDAADENCAYYAKGADGLPVKGKCECKKHKSLRNKIKPINFGLAYGMSEFKLAGDQKISLHEARKLIDEYFDAFPKIGTILNYFGRYGVNKGYIMTIEPYFRKRKFPEWEYTKEYEREAHIKDIKYNPTLGSIERASKNHPIQGTAADITKYSLVLLRRFINGNNLQDKIKLVIQVHDQNTTICTEDIAEWWKVEMTRLMEEAAFAIIPNGLLKADTNITDRWSK